MNRLSEKCAIFLLCLPGFLMAGSVAVPVLTLLIAICLSAVAQLLSGSFIAWAIIFCASASCGAVPVMVCALPLFLYDALHERKWWLVIPAISFTANIGQLSTQQIIFMLTGLAVTLIWYFRVEGLSQSVDHLKSLHDDITEKNLRLAEQNKRLFEAQDNEVHVATLTERNRIAREIHDNVGHMLTRSILQTGALQIINKDEKLKELLAELKSTLDGAMTSIRESVHDLHDDSIDLKRVLSEMADGVNADTAGSHFDVTLQYDAGDYIPGEIKLCVAGIRAATGSRSYSANIPHFTSCCSRTTASRHPRRPQPATGLPSANRSPAASACATWRTAPQASAAASLSHRPSVASASS